MGAETPKPPSLEAIRAGMKVAIDGAPEIAAPNAGPDLEALRAAYLGVLKLALCDLGGSATSTVQRTGSGQMVAKELVAGWVKVRALGKDWPLHALTMVGLERLNDLQWCVESVVADGVEGDLIEAGSWRGGASILARATLDTLGAADRTVWVADSFQGFPAGTEEVNLEVVDFLAVPLEEVQASFARFGCDQGVEFLPGFFEDTLPPLAGRETPWAVVRLDGDSYRATKLALEVLYPRLAVGGYLIIDDYRAFNECRAAIDEFRAEYDITEPVESVDWTCARWRRESTAPLDIPVPAPDAERATRAVERAGHPIVPTEYELAIRRELEAAHERLQAVEAENHRLRAAAPRARARRALGRRSPGG